MNKPTPNMDQLFAYLEEESKKHGMDEDSMQRACAFDEWVFLQIKETVIMSASTMLVTQFKDAGYEPTDERLDIAARAVSVAIQATIVALADKGFIPAPPKEWKPGNA